MRTSRTGFHSVRVGSAFNRAHRSTTVDLGKRQGTSGHAFPIRIGITTLCEFEDRLPRRAVGSSETDQGRMIECRAAAGTVGGECAVELHRRSRAAPVSTAGVPHLSARDGRIASNTPMHGRNLADVIEPT